MTKDRDLLAMAAIALLWCGLLWILHDPGTFNVDEIQYLLATQRFAEHRDFLLPNGYAEFPGNLLLFLHPSDLASLPNQAEMTSFAPPYYPVIAAPFYALAGIQGMFAMTLLCYAAVLMMVPALAARLVDDPIAARRARWIAFAAAIGGTYLADYGIAVINHMFNALLLLAAAALHPVLRAKDGDDPRLGACFLSGLLGGIACGVRVQSVVTAGVLGIGMFMPHRASRLRVAAWAAGFAVPVAGLSLINLSRFGDPFPFSYGMTAQWSTTPLGRVLLGWTGAAAVLALVAAAIVATDPRIQKRWAALAPDAALRLARRILASGLAATAVVVLLPPFARQTLDRIFGVWIWPIAGQWDQSLIMPVFVGWRAAWLQSFPMSLAVLAASVGLLGRVPERARPACVLLAGIVAANMAFVCALPNNGGFFHNQRYLVDAVVFALVLAGAAGSALAPGIARRDAAAGAVAAIVLAAGLGIVAAMEWEALSAVVLSRAILPVVGLALAAGAMLAFSANPGSSRTGVRLVSFLGPSCLLVPLLVHARIAMVATHEYRSSRREACEAMLDFVPDGSLLVVFGGQREPAGLLKESRDVWVADAARTEWKGVPELLREARDRGLREHFFISTGSAPPEMLAGLGAEWRGEFAMEKPFALLRLVPRDQAASANEP